MRAIAFAALLALAATGAPADPIKVLLIDGQNNHDGPATSASLKATLARSKLFAVEVSTTPASKAPKEEWEKWRPDFSKVQVVLVNYNGDSWPAEVKAAYAKFVEGGGGVVNVHASNNPFQDWPEYNKMIGLGWRNAGFADRITVDDDTGKQIRTPKGEGPGGGHGKQHAFVVKVRDPEHPIMKGIPAQWMHTKDELYHGQRGPAENMNILDSAFSDKAPGGTGAHEPITWWIPFGKGKVVTTVLGHHGKGQKDFDALHCVGFQTIVVRSLEWAATGKVTTAVPSNFPTLEKSSIESPEQK